MLHSWIVKQGVVEVLLEGRKYDSNILLESRTMGNKLFCSFVLSVRLSEAQVSMTNAKGDNCKSVRTSVP